MPVEAPLGTAALNRPETKGVPQTSVDVTLQAVVTDHTPARPRFIHWKICG